MNRIEQRNDDEGISLLKYVMRIKFGFRCFFLPCDFKYLCYIIERDIKSIDTQNGHFFPSEEVMLISQQKLYRKPNGP